MRENLLLREKTTQDINRQVEKVLRGLGNPEPPLRLENILELLKLDKKFYSSSDSSYLMESISHILVAGKQIIKRPMIVLDAVRKFELRALYIPDEKRILIDSDLPKLKHRWVEAHEVGHDIIPWHKGLMLGDTQHTISPSAHEQMEAEANYAAGQMLFMRERFTDISNDYNPNMSTIKELKGIFGNTFTTTLWRYIELENHGTPMVGLVTDIPYKLRENSGTLSEDNYFIRSPSFAEKYKSTEDTGILNIILSYCSNQKGGSLGEDDVVLVDDNGEEQIFHFETFSNSYKALTIGVLKEKRKIILPVGMH